MEQLNLFDYIQDLQTAAERKWDIPVDQKRRAEEGWIDNWHYTELENPPEPNIYYCITLILEAYSSGDRTSFCSIPLRYQVSMDAAESPTAL